MSHLPGKITDMLQVCLNGSRTLSECAHLPVTPEQLASAAREAVQAGAEDVHLHPKNAAGHDTLEPDYVAAAFTAVRAAVPDIPVGVTTGAWAAAGVDQRVAAVQAWTVLPDHASVNWHEDGASVVADALLARGVDVEAGLYSDTDAVQRFLSWPRSSRALRVLAEITVTDRLAAPQAAISLLDELEQETNLPVLLHGENDAAWTVLAIAASRGLDMRVGLEDVLHLPDGSPAVSNADLIRTARHLLAEHRGNA